MKKLILIVACALTILGTPQAQAIPVTFNAILTGSNESPVNASPATGFATVIFDVVAHTMEVNVVFAGLLGTTTAAHIHCCTAVANAGNVGVATVTPTFTGFPGGVTSGTYDNVFDMSLTSSYNPVFITANGGSAATAEAALFAGMLDEKSYFNIHTTLFPGGEIRGFLEQSVPEPGSLALLSFALVAVVVSSRKKALGQQT